MSCQRAAFSLSTPLLLVFIPASTSAGGSIANPPNHLPRSVATALSTAAIPAVACSSPTIPPASVAGFPTYYRRSCNFSAARSPAGLGPPLPRALTSIPAPALLAVPAASALAPPEGTPTATSVDVPATAGVGGLPVEASGERGPVLPEPDQAEDPPAPTDGKASVPDIDDIEIIKVTVDRREEDLAKYAGSAEVFRGGQLPQKGVTSVRSLAQLTPFMHFGDQEGNLEVYVRGVGSNNNTEVGDPATAFHLDGIYVPRPRGVGAMLFDVERVEVHRGPQGTARGRNAEAGSINVITRKPELDRTSFEGAVQLGTYSQKVEQATLNLPIRDDLAIRMAMMAETHAPFYENGGKASSLQASESADTLGLRATMLWLPFRANRRLGPMADGVSRGAPVTVILGADFLHDKGTGATGSNFQPNPNPAPTAPVNNPRKVMYHSPQGWVDVYHAGVRADITIDAGPLMAQSLISYRRLEYQQTTGGNDGVWYPGAAASMHEDWTHTDWHTRSESVVQEFRFYAPDKNWWRWTVGAFGIYEAQRVFLGKVQDNSRAEGENPAYVGSEFNMPDVKGLSLAGYLDNSVDVMDGLRLMAGARLTTESKFRCGIANIYRVQRADGGFRIGTEGFQWAGFGRSDCSNDTTRPSEVLQSGIAKSGKSDSKIENIEAEDIRPGSKAHRELFLDWRIGAAWDLSRGAGRGGGGATGHLLYATWSTGHHSGGYNDKDEDYGPEGLNSVEIGWKHGRLAPGLSLTVAGFYYRYTKMQVQRIESELAKRINVGNAHIVGLETTIRYKLPAISTCDASGQDCWRFDLDADVSALAMDARFGSGIESQVDKVQLGNNQLPKAPMLTIRPSLSPRIETPVGSFNGSVSALIRTKHYLSIFDGQQYTTKEGVVVTPYDEVPAYMQVDVGIGFAPNKTVRVDAFVTNITNVSFATSLISTSTMNLRFYNPPRQVGVRAAVSF